MNDSAYYYDQTREYAVQPEPEKRLANKYVHEWVPVPRHDGIPAPDDTITLSADDFSQLPRRRGKRPANVSVPSPNRFNVSLWYNGTNYTVKGTVSYKPTQNYTPRGGRPSDPLNDDTWWETAVRTVFNMFR